MPIQSVKDMVASAEAEVKTYRPDELKALQAAGALVIDLRDVRELEASGRIPGAKHVPRGMLEFWLDPQSPYHKAYFAKDRFFIFYCASGWRSALAAKTAQDMGLEGVGHLQGGFTAWRESGGEVEAYSRREPRV